MRVLSILLLIACFLITLALGAQNQQVVTFNYLLAQGEFTLSILLGIIFALGFIVGWAICGALYIKVRFAHKRVVKKLDKQQQELDKLRAAPAADTTAVVVKD
ncbi:LapA family protein [Thaumasiovibrio sp. DFM-14]|uniref:LapA family protein n=1 Tax=Thaumasiovibrio sp. DFM-14 TaxID=3384792 RepID=UPI00399FD465